MNLAESPIATICCTCILALRNVRGCGVIRKATCRFRVAKTTPTKTGQFVTLWKRIGTGSIQQYDMNDSVDFFVICTRKENHFGKFVFPKSVLSKHDVISIKGEGGKRAIRVYPPWEKSLNRQAQKTQSWQIEYFLDMSQSDSIDHNRVNKLYLLD